jgi:hypothetical protein
VFSPVFSPVFGPVFSPHSGFGCDAREPFATCQDAQP